MQDHLAVNTDEEQTIIEAPEPKALHVRLARCVSNILAPAPISLPVVLLGPFLFSITSVTIGWLVLLLIHGPKNLETTLIITAVSGVVMMVTTLWWKISIHASSLGGVATMLTVLYGAVMLPTFLLLALVSWSRVVLRRHTVAQVVVGSLVSVVISLLILKFRGVN